MVKKVGKEEFDLDPSQALPTDCAAKVQIRSMACEVDERYFA